MDNEAPTPLDWFKQATDHSFQGGAASIFPALGILSQVKYGNMPVIIAGQLLVYMATQPTSIYEKVNLNQVNEMNKYKCERKLEHIISFFCI